jgi:hypothetical protein
VSEGLALDKAGLNFTKGHSRKQEMYARANAETSQGAALARLKAPLANGVGQFPEVFALQATLG